MSNPSSVFTTPLVFSSSQIIDLEQEILAMQPHYILADNSSVIKLKAAEEQCLVYHEEVIALLAKNAELQSTIQSMATLEKSVAAVSASADSAELVVLRKQLAEINQRNILTTHQEVHNTSITLEEKHDLESQVKNLVTSHSKLLLDHTAKTKSLQSIIDASKDQLNERMTDAEASTMNHAALKQKYVSALEQCNTLKRTLSEKEIGLSSLKSDIDALKLVNARQKQTTATSRADIESAEFFANTLTQKIQLLEKQLTCNANDEQRQNTLIVELKSNIEKLTAALNFSKQQLKDLEQKRREEDAAHSRNLSASSTKHKTQSRDNLKRVDDEDLVKQLRSTIQDLELQLKKLKQQPSTSTNTDWEHDFAKIQRAYTSQQHEYTQIEQVIDAYERQFRDIQVIIQTLTEIGQLPPLDQSILSLVSLTKHPLPFSLYFNQIEMLYVQLRQERETLVATVTTLTASADTRCGQIATMNEHLNRKNLIIKEGKDEIHNLEARIKTVELLRQRAEANSVEVGRKLNRVVGKCKLFLDISPSKQRSAAS